MQTIDATTRQYRITVNGAQSIRNDYPTDWPRIAEAADERGLSATMEQREVFADDEIMAALANPRGYLRLRDGRVISPWRVVASVA